MAATNIKPQGPYTLTAKGPRGTYCANLEGSESYDDDGVEKWTQVYQAWDALGEPFGFFARDLNHAAQMLKEYAE